MEPGKSSPLRPWGGGAILGADSIGKAAFAMVREEERIFQGIVFCPGDPELAALKLRTHNLNVDYNNTYEDEYEKRAAILGEILGEMGEGTRIQGPIAFHYGKHTKIGRNFFGNFNLTIQDDGEVTIGDRCNFGPNVTIVTPIHPMVPGCVIGAGAVVTRDIPPRTFAAGNPCRVIREITEQDSMAHKPEILADFTVPQSFEGLY